MQIALIKGLVAGSVTLILPMALGASLPGGTTILADLVIGFLGYGLLVLFVLGLRHLGAARTGAYFSLAPLIGALLAVLLLGEPLSLRLLGAGILMTVGLWLHLAERHEHEPRDHEHRHVHDEHHQHAHDSTVAMGEAHSHWHRHDRLVHRHPHYPDLHHQHRH